MLKHIKILLERNAYLISVAFTILIIYLSLAPTTEVIIKINTSDKFLHVFGYFILSLSWFFAIKSSHRKFKNKLLIAMTIIIFGMVLEVLQGNMGLSRTMDYYDVFANSIGIIAAFITFNPLLSVYKTF